MNDLLNSRNENMTLKENVQNRNMRKGHTYSEILIKYFVML